MPTRSPERAGLGPLSLRRERLACASVLALAVGATGCGTLGTHQGTAPVAPGEWQVAASAGVVGLVDTEQKTKAPGADVQLALRRGLATNLDAGLKLSPFGLDALLKWRVLSGSWPVAVAPSVGFARTPRTGLTTNAFFTWAHLPIIFGHAVSDKVSINAGPHLIYGYYLPAVGDPAHGLSLGGFVNLEWRVAPRARLVPEIGVFRTLVGEVPITGWMAYVGPGVLVDL